MTTETELEPFEFTVKRSRWLNGGSDPNEIIHSCLLNNNNKMCCLGFMARACGLSTKTIRNCGSPSSVLEKDSISKKTIKKIMESPLNRLLSAKKFHEFINENNIGNNIICANDTAADPNERESELKKLFSKVNITINFED